MHREVALEAGDLERTAHLEARRGERERVAPGELRARLDERAEHRRVDEGHLGEVDDQSLRGALDGPSQRLPQGRRGVEVELARQREDERVPALGEADDRIAI